ncbi:MAG: cytidine deaminase [Salinivirgaceae bacterium]|nr:cytidine deaminase [Salinivirgaceae bacterium]MDD4747212.1 cytidine deaminase [Salinivirgaceae bacterium]MDY0279249.1 cytidine deaminase [Salinivirgaceae bacterium]
MKKLEITSKITEYQSSAALGEAYANLCKQALEVASKAYAPYSNFQVGAALLLSNGEVITGNNQENAAYPSGLCAERVAIFYANASYPNESVEAIAITAIQNGAQIPEPISPCGSCRQVLAETQFRYKNKMKVIMHAKNKTWIIDNSNDLLPLSFSQDDLATK